MKLFPQKRLNSLLGLSVGGTSVCACLVTRGPGGTTPTRALTIALPHDFLHPAPDQLGEEINRQLVAAGIRERLCTVALPAAWIMSLATEVPELSPADLDSFLQLAAEQGFPCELAQLQIARSVCRVGGTTYVTQLAVRQEHLRQLAAVLAAAGLKPVSLTPGLAVLPGAVPPAGSGQITLTAGTEGAAILVAAGGGIASLRTWAADPGQPAFNLEAVARELRITFEQLPAGQRADLRALMLDGPEAAVQMLRQNLAAWAGTAGLVVSSAAGATTPLGERLAAAAASGRLEGGPPGPEFLPSHPSRWAGLLARYNSRRIASVSYTVAAAAGLGLVAFGWQEYNRWSLRSQWSAMQAQVSDLEGVQARIVEFRPWYDTGFHTLSILRRVTECFPDNGSVTAKSVEIHGPAAVSLTGTARDNPALLHALDQLRKSREIQNLKLEQIRGKTPQQFTLSFRWNPGT